MMIEEAKIARFKDVLSYGFQIDADVLPDSIIRSRIRRIIQSYNLKDINDLIHCLEYHNSFSENIVAAFTETDRDFFRDPIFLRQFRKRLWPILKNADTINIWIPEVGNGTELITLSIILIESGVYDKTRILATDHNLIILNKAKKGVFQLGKLKKNVLNYDDSGGKESFTDYFEIDGNLIVKDSVYRNVDFVCSSILETAVDKSFDLIFCRNVLLYYDNNLKRNVIEKFFSSMSRKGFLILGEKERDIELIVDNRFRNHSGKERVYQKIK